jgi:hypothetical protein
VTPGVIERAAAFAKVQAAARSGPVNLDDVRIGIRQQLDGELTTLGRRVEWKQSGLPSCVKISCPVVIDRPGRHLLGQLDSDDELPVLCERVPDLQVERLVVRFVSVRFIAVYRTRTCHRV